MVLAWRHQRRLILVKRVGLKKPTHPENLVLKDKGSVEKLGLRVAEPIQTIPATNRTRPFVADSVVREPTTEKWADNKSVETEWSPESAARSLLTMIIKGQYAAVAETFDAAVNAGLSAEKLKTIWQTVQFQAGNYQSVAANVNVQSVRPHKVVDFLGTFEKTKLIFRTAYDDNRCVAGIFFLPALPDRTNPVKSREDTSDLGPPDVQLQTPTATLFGTIDVSERDSQFSVILVLSGSGPNDRDGNQATLKSDYLKKMSSALAEKGIAVLPFDKRGSGKSQFVLESGF